MKLPALWVPWIFPFLMNPCFFKNSLTLKAESTRVREQSDHRGSRLRLTRDLGAKQHFGGTTAGSRGTQRRRSTWTNRHCYQRTRSEREREENGWTTSTEQGRAFRETCWGTIRRYKRLQSERRQSLSRRERQDRDRSSARRNTMLGEG